MLRDNLECSRTLVLHSDLCTVLPASMFVLLAKYGAVRLSILSRGRQPQERCRSVASSPPDSRAGR